MTTRKGTKRTAFAACLLGGVLAGCSAPSTSASNTSNTGASNPPGNAPALSAEAASPAAGSYEGQVLGVGRRFAQCARSHGFPNFPDPAVQGGGLAFPDTSKQDVESAQQACAEVLRALPPLPRPDPPRAEDLRHMRQFSACMREHGVPDWPDPSGDGTFAIRGTPMDVSPGQPTSATVVQARAACIRFEDTWRIYVS